KGRGGVTWELSSARAAELVEALIAGGMAADSLSAAGYAEFAPIDRSGTPEARVRNQRVEITLVPKAEELFATAAPSASAPPAAPQPGAPSAPPPGTRAAPAAAKPS